MSYLEERARLQKLLYARRTLGDIERPGTLKILSESLNNAIAVQCEIVEAELNKLIEEKKHDISDTV
jgi:hypothetical protein